MRQVFFDSGHLPGGPVGPSARWAATSVVDVGRTGGEKGARDKVTKRRRRKEEVDRGRGSRDP